VWVGGQRGGVLPRLSLGVRTVAEGRESGVISVVARCRRWTLEGKLGLVEEVLRLGASVASVASVADRHGMSRSPLLA